MGLVSVSPCHEMAAKNKMIRFWRLSQLDCSFKAVNGCAVEQKDSLLAKKAGEKRSSFLNSHSSFPEQLGDKYKGFLGIAWYLQGGMGQGVEGDSTMQPAGIGGISQLICTVRETGQSYNL